LKQRNVFVKRGQSKFIWYAERRKGRIKSNDVAPHVGLSFASRGHPKVAGVWVHLSSGFSCKVSAIESWLSIVEPQPRMGFGQISETTERIQLIRVPEPASQVHFPVVSDISDDIFPRNFSLCISDDINSPEIQGKWGPLRQRGSVPHIFKERWYFRGIIIL
jgi:hypothetical protein